ncbi:MAG TPA: carboxypeptidase-like regulatory domain-containing protein [Bryobacteraceae bacterium]|nr:carboxypeptidase-like regulatory domain-containing protein [Bryobacteraceae bacterium]
MRRTILCLALTLPLLLGAPMTKLTIEVTNPSGKPVPQASVIVRFIKGHSVFKLGKSIRKEWELHTNEEGIARIPPIPQGTIQIQVIAKPYQTFGQNFEIDDEQKTIAVKLNAQQQQYSAH